MDIQDLVIAVMDCLPDFKDTQKLRRLLNRVIGEVNLIGPGIYSDETAVTAGAAESGYSFSDTLLTFPSTIKEILRVWSTDSEGEKTNYPKKSEVYVEDNSEAYCYCMPAKYEILFPDENEKIIASGVNINIRCKKAMAKVELDDRTITLPADWEEGFISGVLAKLTLSGDHKNEDVYKTNIAIYSRFLNGLREREDRLMPADTDGAGYNYNNPGN